MVRVLTVAASALAAILALAGCAGERVSTASSGLASSPAASSPVIALPQPRPEGDASLEEAIAARRSVRTFTQDEISLAQLAQLLWAAQGVTDRQTGYRAAPSAGALYPLEVLVAAERVAGLPAGLYRYLPKDHSLSALQQGSSSGPLAEAALSQAAVREAPLVLVITGVFTRTTGKYGARGERYVYMEAGHAAQNVCLQAEALKLGTVTIGAFDDAAIRRELGQPESERPLYLLPCGVPSRE